MDRPKRNSLAGLPDEAMLEILARVPFRSVCRSKCVAKAWRDLIDDPHNRGRLPQTLQGFFSISYRNGGYLEHFFVKYSASSVPLDIDPCFSFLTKLPEIESLHLLDTCNGLLLFKHSPKKSKILDVLGYIVCNPTTKHWATVPVCACYPPSKALLDTYLAFDPAVSPHFHLIQFWKGSYDLEAPIMFAEFTMLVLSVHTYSSETGVWSHSQTDRNELGQMEGWRHKGTLKGGPDKGIFVNGILHLIVSVQGRHQIVAVDVQGVTKRTIKMPAAASRRHWHSIPCIGQSQGRLHCINLDFDTHYSTPMLKLQGSELSFWELQDYDTQEWVLKDTVSLFRLFGMTDGWWDSNIIVIHPDRNVVFIHIPVEPMNRLIAYDMDSKEVSVVATLSEIWVGEIVPYIPYFSESPALTNKN